MDHSQGIALLQQKLGQDVIHKPEELLRLATELDSMPLAMAQAAAYIRRRAPLCSVRQYLDKLGSKTTRTEVLDHSLPDLQRDRDAENCIMRTWHVSFEHIRQQKSSAADLLSLMSFFDRHAIPGALLYNRKRKWTANPEPKSRSRPSVRLSLRSFFSRQGILNAWARKERDEQRTGSERDLGARSKSGNGVVVNASLTVKGSTPNLHDDIQLLRDYSLVTIVAGSDTFEMHRLVQLATQDWLKVHGSFERWGRQSMINLDKACPWVDYENWDVCQTLLPHVLAALKVELSNEHALLRQASIFSKGARYTIEAGAYTDGQKLGEKALKIREALLGPEHRDTISIMQRLGVVYQFLEQTERSESVLSEGLTRAERLFGGDDEFTLDCMYCLAPTYAQMGKLVEAEALHRKVLQRYRKKFGEEHRETLVAADELALTLSDRGRYSEAEDLHHRVLGIATKICPAGDPDILRAQYNLATTYYQTARYEEAVKLFEEVLLGESELLGSDHPDTLKSMDWLSFTLYKLGRRRSALDLLRDYADKSERKLGRHHAETIRSYKRLKVWEAECGPDETSGDGIDTKSSNGNGGV